MIRLDRIGRASGLYFDLQNIEGIYGANTFDHDKGKGKESGKLVVKKGSKIAIAVYDANL